MVTCVSSMYTTDYGELLVCFHHSSNNQMQQLSFVHHLCVVTDITV